MASIARKLEFEDLLKKVVLDLAPNKLYQVLPPTLSRKSLGFPDFKVKEALSEYPGDEGSIVIDTDLEVIIFDIPDAMYHNIVDFMGSLLLYKNTFKNNFYAILNIHNNHSFFKSFYSSFFENEKIKYKIVDLKTNDLYVKNLSYISFNKEDYNLLEPMRLNAIAKYYKSNTEHDLGHKKNIYLSRKDSKVKQFKLLKTSGEILPSSDQRILNEELLENYFKSIGFEIIDAEKEFNDYESQVMFFKNVNILAGSSGTGLLNSIYMSPDSTVIEIAVEIPLHTKNENSGEFYVSYNYHQSYSKIAFYSGVTYLQISAGNDAKNIIKKIKNSRYISSLLSHK